MKSEDSKPPECWWCLRSKLTGQLILDGCDENGQMVGHLMTFWDRDEAEAAAVMHRETCPKLLIEATPLPATPPLISRRDDYGGEVVAHQMFLSRGTERVWIEFRPSTGSPSPILMKILRRVFRRMVSLNGQSIRVGPELIVRLGERNASSDFTEEDVNDSEAA